MEPVCIRIPDGLRMGTFRCSVSKTLCHIYHSTAAFLQRLLRLLSRGFQQTLVLLQHRQAAHGLACFLLREVVHLDLLMGGDSQEWMQFDMSES